MGMLTLLPGSRFPPICAEDASFVSTTATAPRYRRRGIGRMLVRVAADWASHRWHAHMDVSFNPRARSCEGSGDGRASRLSDGRWRGDFRSRSPNGSFILDRED